MLLYYIVCYLVTDYSFPFSLHKSALKYVHPFSVNVRAVLSTKDKQHAEEQTTHYSNYICGVFPLKTVSK